LSEQTGEDRKREARRKLLGSGPAEHGGGYRSPKSGWLPDAGCCGLEVFGAMSVFAGLVVTAYSLLP
jgi:hypothetical protein